MSIIATTTTNAKIWNRILILPNFCKWIIYSILVEVKCTRISLRIKFGFRTSGFSSYREKTYLNNGSVAPPAPLSTNRAITDTFLKYSRRGGLKNNKRIYYLTCERFAAGIADLVNCEDEEIIFTVYYLRNQLCSQWYRLEERWFYYGSGAGSTNTMLIILCGYSF
jgi:hypothetical protein